VPRHVGEAELVPHEPPVRTVIVRVAPSAVSMSTPKFGKGGVRSAAALVCPHAAAVRGWCRPPTPSRYHDYLERPWNRNDAGRTVGQPFFTKVNWHTSV
jgi:hypothetical protein